MTVKDSTYSDHLIGKVQVETPFPKEPVVSVAVTHCGNFGILGYLSGQIQKVSMQTGKDKGIMGSLEPKSVHKGRITGLGIDYLNKYLVSASLDGTIKQWDFYRATLIKSINMASPQHLVYNRMNDLVAISTSNLEVKVLNSNSSSTQATTKLTLVRSIKDAATNQVTDMGFSNDGKWLLLSSLDKCIRVWDLLTGTLIDWI